MPDVVNINQHDSFITINSSGILGLHDMNESLKAIQNINKVTGINKVLIDATHLVKLPPEPQLHGFV